MLKRDRIERAPVEVLATRLINVPDTDREPVAARLAALEARVAALEAERATPAPPRR